MAALLGLGLALGACATQSGSVHADSYLVRKKLARELIARGDYATAFAYADDLHRQRADDAEVLVLRGTIYRERGLNGEAEADLTDAVRIDGKMAEAHAALGILYDVTRRPTEAEPQHRQAVQLDPHNAAYLNNLGFSLFLRSKIKDAIDCYKQAARLDPMSRRVRTNLGFAYAANGDLRDAAHEFEMGGTPAEAKNNLGFAYEQRGDLQHAYDLYLEAARLDPKSTRAHSNLVHAAAELGRELPADVTTPPVSAAAGPVPTAEGPKREDKEP